LLPLNRAIVPGDNPMAYRQTHTRTHARRASGEEGIEDTRKMLCGNAGAVISHAHADAAGLASSRDEDRPRAIPDRLHCIEH
jgi:hypothetical protein